MINSIINREVEATVGIFILIVAILCCSISCFYLYYKEYFEIIIRRRLNRRPMPNNENL